MTITGIYLQSYQLVIKKSKRESALHVNIKPDNMWAFKIKQCGELTVTGIYPHNE